MAPMKLTGGDMACIFWEKITSVRSEQVCKSRGAEMGALLQDNIQLTRIYILVADVQNTEQVLFSITVPILIV